MPRTHECAVQLVVVSLVGRTSASPNGELVAECLAGVAVSHRSGLLLERDVVALRGRWGLGNRPPQTCAFGTLENIEVKSTGARIQSADIECCPSSPSNDDPPAPHALITEKIEQRSRV